MSYEDRNPSPPPGADLALKDIETTNISGTTFSKQWIFQCLRNAIEVVEAERSNEGEEIANIDEGLENELCSLWDMSANEEVAEFLEEFQVSEMFVHLIKGTHSPRLVEIFLGILANACTFDRICASISRNDSLVRVCLWLLGSTDTPTLLQLIRLILTCLAHPTAGPYWLDHVCDNLAPTVDHLQTILRNSLNGDLVSSALKLADRLSDSRSDISSALANVGFLRGLTAAALQMLSEPIVLEDFWRILYNLERETQLAPLLSESCIEDLASLLKAFIAPLVRRAGGSKRHFELKASVKPEGDQATENTAPCAYLSESLETGKENIADRSAQLNPEGSTENDCLNFDDVDEQDVGNMTRRWQRLCLPFCFLANLSDKTRHLLFDDSAVSDSAFNLLQELELLEDRENACTTPEEIEFRTILKGALLTLTRGFTR